MDLLWWLVLGICDVEDVCKKCVVALIDDVSKRYIGQVKEKIGLEIYVMRSAYLEGWRDKLPLMLKIEGGIITETREVL